MSMKYIYDIDCYMCESGPLEHRERTTNRKKALQVGALMSREFPFVEVNKSLMKVEGDEMYYEEFVEQVKSWRKE